MSIRVRLAVWYGALTALTLLVASLLSYAYHARGHYDDLDRVLVQNLAHAVPELAHLGRGQLPRGSGDLEVVVRVYDPQARAVGASSDAPNLPGVWPPAALAAPSGPAYGSLVAAFPGLRQPVARPAGSAFQTLTHAGQRWRILIQTLRPPVAGVGFVEALTPLGRLDSSLGTFRSLLVALDLASVLVVVTVGLWLARGALDPITRLTATARVIAQSQDLSRRVQAPSTRDELGELAATFNAMLANLEEASSAQRRFVADASHELRAPLTAIQGNLELLRRQRGMPETERLEAIDEAARETARLSRLVSDLLVLARADAGVTLNRKPVDLDGVVLDALGLARRLPGGERLRVESLEPLRVLGDADRLTQLVLILVDNALKYSPPGAPVTVSLSSRGPHAVLEVRDRGPGIPPDQQRRVFERFYRIDPGRGRDPGGTGLGLSIARWIAEQHQAEVSLSSPPPEPGQTGASASTGTLARVKLPLLRG
ncbi:MAG TPA: HAMP domain-containing sensor histidine kinase [Deinococcales bacterium]|nr:HAMP domain-containing sensor histidine kinase [Deinococcales bacterium]